MAQKINRTAQSKETFTAAEQDTGRVWVDGRTIYRKVLRGQMTIGVGVNLVAHGITFTGSMEIVSLNGGIKLGQPGSGGEMQTFQYRETAGNWINLTGVDGTNIKFTGSFGWGSSWYTVVMEYVK